MESIKIILRISVSRMYSSQVKVRRIKSAIVKEQCPEFWQISTSTVLNNVCSKPVRRISFELYVKVGAHTRDQSIFIAWVEEYRRILENHVPKEYKAGNIENWLQIPPIGRGGGEWGRIVRILQSLKGESGKFDLDTTKILRPLQVQQSDWSLEFTNILIPSSLDTVYSWHQTEVRIVHHCRTLDQVISYDWLLIRKHL